MRADGLHVTGSQGPFTVAGQGHAPDRRPSITEPFDFVFISVQVLRHRVGHPLHQALREGRWLLRGVAELLERRHRCRGIVGRRTYHGLHRLSYRGRPVGTGGTSRAAALWAATTGHHVFRVGEYNERLSHPGRERWPRCWTASTAPTPPTTCGGSAGRSCARTEWATAYPPPRASARRRWPMTPAAG